jgi:4-hydroxymandelate oxidase
MTSDIINLHDLELAAAARLDANALGYYRSGADDERVLRANVEAWSHVRLLPRVLVDVSSLTLATTVLGMPVAMPVLVAPTAMQAMAHPEGELATARAAGSAGTIMILSTISNHPVEQVLAAASGPVWFQLYVFKDRGATRELVRRVEAAGCRALVLTVDLPIVGNREADVRNRFHMPSHLSLPNMLDGGTLAKTMPGEAASALALHAASQIDPALTWKDVEWLRSQTSLPIVLKGILRPDDAVRAFDHGARAVVVSNHGGRQLDATPATAEALPRVVDAVSGRGEVLVDGGIRRGTDVVRALALGARAVLVGRPILWGLAVDGAAGATRALAMLREETDRAMALCGCACPEEVTGDLICRWRGASYNCDC